ncbi:MAG TPA: hypothetical protein VEI57_08800 [Nitrospirota bacterium]|nr:hypothetical protein [Nitrospirota bacterium]
MDADIKDLKVKERNMAKAFFSMNNHQVATPEMMSEEARSYIIFFREADGKMSAYIGIHLLLTGRKLFYSHTSNPFSERDLLSVEEEARSFAEGLGAMLDEVDLSTMSRDAREHWIDSQDIFTSERETSAAPAASATPEQAPSVAENLSITRQQPQLQPAPAAQSVEQPTHTQTEPASSIPQSSEFHQDQPEPAPLTPTVPPSPQEGQDRQQSVQHHISPTPIVPDSATTTAVLPPQAKSGMRQAEKTAPAAHPKEEGRESTELVNKKEVLASTVPKERLSSIIQKAMKAGIVWPTKQTLKKDVKAATGVVSRDREALARLLASF